MLIIGPAAASFFLCLLAILALRPIAVAVDLIDRPGGHKTHQDDVPVVGGLAMLLGVVLGMGLVPAPDLTATALLGGCAILVTVGLLDDRFGLSPWSRLAAQMAAAVLLMLAAKSIVHTIGAPFGGNDIWLDGWYSYVFTIVAVVGAVNAFNMLDGMDGLAGAMAMVALVSLAVLSHGAGLIIALSASAVFIGAIAAFLLANFPFKFNRHFRCFMGDSGSTLLGFAVAWIIINVSQSPVQAAEPVTMLWVVAVPLYELIWTIIRRGARGISPFRSDKDHLHHVLQRAGFGIRGTFAVLVLFAAVLSAFGIVLDKLDVSDEWSFVLLIVAGVCVVRLIYRAELFWKFAPASLRARPAPS